MEQNNKEHREHIKRIPSLAIEFGSSPENIKEMFEDKFVKPQKVVIGEFHRLMPNISKGGNRG